jgi:hypothetical protein
VADMYRPLPPVWRTAAAAATFVLAATAATALIRRASDR